MAALSPEEAFKVIQQKRDEATKILESHGARIVIMGNAGEGKSTLIQSVFGRPMVESDSASVAPGVGQQGLASGHGSHTTSGAHLYVGQADGNEDPDIEHKVSIWDTEGFHTQDSNDNTLKAVREIVQKSKRQSSRFPIDDPRHLAALVHAVWWVVTDRPETTMVAAMNALFGLEVPIFVVVNKCDRDAKEVDTILQNVKRVYPEARAVLPVVAQPSNGPMRKVCESCESSRISVTGADAENPAIYTCKNSGCNNHNVDIALKPNYGIDVLLEKTREALPGYVQASFLRIQENFNVQASNRFKSKILIGAHVAISLGIGASPIPYSDFPLLVANQVVMFLEMSAIYGLEIKRETATSIVWYLLSIPSVAALAGGGLLIGGTIKWIPIIGTYVGGCTDAAISATVTSAMGLVMMELMGKATDLNVTGELTKENLEVAMAPSDMRKFFTNSLMKGAVSSP